jgi:Ca2+-binding EF-hand superfamily protein
VLNKDQLRLLMAALGEDIDEDTINELMVQIDYDHSGTINCE